VAARSPWVVLAIVILFLAIYVPVIRAEEKFLGSRFPQFEAYARQVPRLVPGRTKYANTKGSFSRQRYLRHREYNALIGTAAMIAALAAKLLWLQR
jgi:hypothetical protein